jgi:hypothetical protein
MVCAGSGGADNKSVSQDCNSDNLQVCKVHML